MDQSLISLSGLQFRRQYLLGPSEYKPNERWNCLPLNHGLFLSTHPDLQVSTRSQKEILLILVGTAIDSLVPQRTASDITKAIVSTSTTIQEVLDQTNSLAGRWLVIFQDHKGTYLFTDPCGFRQVYYCFSSNGVWCGSQPEIIKAVEPLNWRIDEPLLHFLTSKNHITNESVWIGNRTIYEECYRLIPNHYLDINRAEQVRFYPEKPLQVMDTSSVVDSAASILQGIFEGIAGQQQALQALTAGWDSRILLAASKNYSHNIEYYVDRQGVLSNHHPDVWVPKLLAKKLRIDFHVQNSDENPPGWFISLLSKNVTGARVLPKTRPIYASLIGGENRININGNGSEICRSYYDLYCADENNKIDINRLPGINGFIDDPYILHIVNEWKKDLCTFGVQDRNVLDMLYWEQRLGIWGAQYPAEKDIAIEEFSPFNCRLLIDTLLSSHRDLRQSPNYALFRMLIHKMWPEALSVPINPLSIGSGILFWKKKLRRIIPSSIKNPFSNK